jgi:DNA-binding XRE family transcriptional regulator
MFKNLIAEMARNGYTREMYAKALDVSLPTLRKKLKGEVPFNMDEICKSLSLFGKELTFEYLFQKS